MNRGRGWTKKQWWHMSAQSGQCRHVQLLFLGATEADPRPDQIPLASLIWGGQVIINISQKNTMLRFFPRKAVRRSGDRWPIYNSVWPQLLTQTPLSEACDYQTNFSLGFDLGRVFFPSLHGDLYVCLQVVIFSPLSIFCYFIGWLVSRMTKNCRTDFHGTCVEDRFP